MASVVSKTLYLPPSFDIYQQYHRTEVTITAEQKRSGWRYFAGFFHDGEQFLMLPAEYFETPKYLDFDLSGIDFDLIDL